MTEYKGRLKIAYYSINDPLDKRSWSGVTYYLGQALQKNIGDVHFLGPVKIPWLLDKSFRAIQKCTRLFFKTEWIPKYSLLKNMYAVFFLKRKMKRHQYDFLMAPAAASELAYLNIGIPVIYFGDATYKIYSETYKKEFKNVCSLTKWEGSHLEKKALKKSSLVIFTSQWAAKSAINDYGIEHDKIEVIQMAANIDVTPGPEIIFKKEQDKTLTLLFLSVDWERKGGAIAFNTLQHLYLQGIPVKLIICGCTPPAEYTHPCMEVIPFLNKNDAEDSSRFVQILSSAHFLLLPTRADCTPVVNCECNAYGVPVITTSAGGISETVKDGVNGYCLTLQAGGADYALLINSIFSDKKRYHELIKLSSKKYNEEMNWDRFAESLRQVLYKHKIINGVVTNKKAAG